MITESDRPRSRTSRRARALAPALLLVLALAATVVPLRPVSAAPQQASQAKAAGATPARAVEKSDYFGIYLATANDAKIGSMTITRTDGVTTPDGKTPAIRTESIMKLDLNVLGADSTTTTTSRTWSDPKSGRPLRMESRTEAGGRINTVTATYTDRSVTYSASVQGTPQKGTLTLKEGERFLFEPTTGGAEFTPKVGAKLTGKIFVSELFRLIDSRIEVVAEETVVIGGQSVKAFKVNDINEIGNSTLYMTASGDLLRLDGPIGMQMRKEPKEIALAAPDPNAPRPDLALSVGITATGEKPAAPREARTARYEISGVTRDLPPSDTVQAVEYQAAAGSAEPGREKQRTAIVTVTTRPLPESSPARRFAKPEAAPAALQPYLKATTYVPSDAAEFRALATKVVGETTDTAVAAEKIADYVHTTVKPDPSIPALRTARDIHADPRGVCRDYTTYFAAIARAAGIPTRQCTGVAYVNGKFLYHAWPEVWVGGDDWIALEPTWGAPFADATHIKMAQGEVTDVVNFAADMGKYQIKVLEVK